MFIKENNQRFNSSQEQINSQESDPFHSDLLEKLPQTIEVFTDYYGPLNKKTIEEKFSQFMIVEYTSLYGSRVMLSQLSSDVTSVNIQRETKRQEVFQEKKDKKLAPYGYDQSLFDFYQRFQQPTLLPVLPFENNNMTYTNAWVTDNQILPFPVIMIDLRDSTGKYDYIVNHELNHGLASFIRPSSKDCKKIKIGSGIFSIEEEFNEDSKTFETVSKNPFYNLNEAINEKMARDITDVMHQRGIFYRREKSNRPMYTHFNQKLKAVEELFQKHISLIKDCQVQGNFDELITAVGEKELLRINGECK